MWALAVTERLDVGEFYLYSVLKSLSITGRCPVNMNITTPKIGALHRYLQIQEGDFFFEKKAVRSLIKFL
jgi:hypothetical protein